MSKEKVAANKERKKNYKKYAKKEKANKILRFIPLIVVGVLLIGFIAYSGATKYQEYKTENPTMTKVDLNPLTDYITAVQDKGTATIENSVSASK